jgi:hypothetical protein
MLTLHQHALKLVDNAEAAGFEFEHERGASATSGWYVRHANPRCCPFFYGWAGPYESKPLAAAAAMEALKRAEGAAP